MRIRMEAFSEDLLLRLEQARDNLSQNRREYARGLSARVMNRVKERTPVDTGRARAGWNGEIGVEEEGEVTKISTTNEVDYIAFLEFGTTRTPARAMVRSSLSQSGEDVCSVSLNLFGA